MFPKSPVASGQLAIRSCFVDTLSGFKAPGMFLTSDAVRRCPAFLGRVRANRVPRRHRYYQGTKLKFLSKTDTFSLLFNQLS